MNKAEKQWQYEGEVFGTYITGKELINRIYEGILQSVRKNQPKESTKKQEIKRKNTNGQPQKDGLIWLLITALHIHKNNP